MNRSTKILLATFVVVLCGVVFWFLRPTKPTIPQAAPLVHAAAPSPAVQPREESPAAQESQGEITQLVSTPALAKASPASTAATPPAAAQPAQSGTGQPAAATAVTRIPDPKPQTSNAEVAATARMYAAHASLRTPEVSDPDSKANKQILQTMVLKALAQQTAPPAATTTQTTSR